MILLGLEASLQDCEQRCAGVERRPRGRRRRIWLITLCVAALITGIDLVILATIIPAARLTLALLGAGVLAGACWCSGVPLYRWARRRAAWRNPARGNVLHR